MCTGLLNALPIFLPVFAQEGGHVLYKGIN